MYSLFLCHHFLLTDGSYSFHQNGSFKWYPYFRIRILISTSLTKIQFPIAIYLTFTRFF